MTHFLLSFAHLFSLWFPNAFDGFPNIFWWKSPGTFCYPRPAKEWRRWRSQRNQDKSERELLLVPPNHIPSDTKYTEHKEEMREVLSPKYSSSHPEQVRTHSVFMISSKAHLSQCSTEGGIMSLKFKAEESPTCCTLLFPCSQLTKVHRINGPLS